MLFCSRKVFRTFFPRWCKLAKCKDEKEQQERQEVVCCNSFESCQKFLLRTCRGDYCACLVCAPDYYQFRFVASFCARRHSGKLCVLKQPTTDSRSTSNHPRRDITRPPVVRRSQFYLKIQKMSTFQTHKVSSVEIVTVQCNKHILTKKTSDDYRYFQQFQVIFICFNCALHVHFKAYF